MSIPRRHSAPESFASHERTFFVTSSIAQKRALLASTRSAELFIDTLYEYRAAGKCRLDGFVVMPDHFHVIVTVTDLSIERALQFIKGGFAFRAAKQLGFRAPIWQRGFSEIRILDQQGYAKLSEYIRQNPVKRHLVTHADEYLYSSANPRFELDRAPQRLKPRVYNARCGTPEGVP